MEKLYELIRRKYMNVPRLNIKSIQVEGFQNIYKNKIELNNMVALISLNSYGKSNFLKAIDFGINFIKASQELKSDMMSWKKGIPFNKNNAFSDFSIEIELTTTIKDKVYQVLYGYQFRWIKDDNSGASIIGEWLKLKLDEKGQKFNLLISRDLNKALYKSSETGRCNTEISIEENHLIINKLKAYDNLYYNEIVTGINALKVYVERNFDASPFYSPNPIVDKNIDILDIDSKNLPRVCYFLQKEYSDKFNVLQDAFMQLFPQFTDIHVESFSLSENLKSKFPVDLPFKLLDEVYVLYVQDVNLNQPISFEYMSDGAKRVFLLLTKIIMTDIMNISLLAIEEPENSIHPGLLQDYLRVIDQFLGDCKVVLASHSPYILQYLDVSNVYVGMPRKDGIAEFCRVKRTAQRQLYNDAKENNLSSGDYLFELLNGSETEHNILKEYLEIKEYE